MHPHVMINPFLYQEAQAMAKGTRNQSKDVFDFMKECYKNPAVHGVFEAEIYQDPQPTDQKLSEWFTTRGYEVGPLECKNIKELMNLSQSSPCLHY